MAERSHTLPAAVSTRLVVVAASSAALLGIVLGLTAGVPWAGATALPSDDDARSADTTAATAALATAAPDRSPATPSPTSPSSARSSGVADATPVGATTPARREPLAVDPLPTSTSPEGWLVAGGSSTDDVTDDGRVVRWTLEVEPATGLDLSAVLGTAEAALYDPRSWARDHHLERVDDPADATIRVLVATPPTVDRLCARAGLVTNGIFSCWNGRVAAITLSRWRDGANEISDLELYRTYVVNHEVGHGLGRDHVDCGGAGRRADVMQQQTRTLAGCTANPWPYPDAAG